MARGSRWLPFLRLQVQTLSCAAGRYYAALCRRAVMSLHSPSLSFTLLSLFSLLLLLLLLLSLLKRAGGFHDDFEICLRTSAGVETVGPSTWNLGI